MLSVFWTIFRCVHGCINDDKELTKQEESKIERLETRYQNQPMIFRQQGQGPYTAIDMSSGDLPPNYHQATHSK